MNQSPRFVLIAVFVTAAVFTGALLLGRDLISADEGLLINARVVHERITPNADGDTDVTTIFYEITRNAAVSIYFENEAGERYYFRRERARGVGPYQVNFSGVVDGYRLPDEPIQGEILNRLLPNGTYEWVIVAEDDSGVIVESRGPLTIADADGALPEMRDFSLDRTVFSPNQDGIDDRVEIQFDLQKEADVRVFLVQPSGLEEPIFEKERNIEPGAPGRHYYDYEGGVDNNALPPADGTYPIVAIAADAEGQRLRVTSEITIAFGGLPRADIIAPPVGDTVSFSATSVQVCETIYFTLTVENDGTAPLRTTGPAPGTVYDSDWNYNTLGWETEAGAWRVAIGYENEITNYPFRWGLGAYSALERIGDDYYLLPGARAIVTGGIRLVGPLGERNPQPVWAGLIHEDVAIDAFNSRVDPRAITIGFPEPNRVTPCPEREIPRRTDEK